MRKSVTIWIFLLLLIIIGIALIDASVKRPIDWRKTYNIKSKIPFGLFVFHEELPNILGKNRVYADFGNSFYEQINKLDSLKYSQTTLVSITEYADFGEYDVDKILDFTSAGGEMFISAVYQNELLMDTLGIYEERLDYQRFLPTDQRVTYNLGQDTSQAIKVDKYDEFRIFSRLDPKTCTILGYLNSRGRALPNFVKVKYGKGTIYLHTLPDVFTNYHFLQEDKYKYATEVLQSIQGHEVRLWDENFNAEIPQTPLRVILSKPGFSQAWYLLLIGLISLLLFRSKRDQRAIPIHKPEPNLSKEFAETIGNLYYENGQPGNIILKKIDYFMFTIRSMYHLDTMDILNEKFLKQLSQKTGVELIEVKRLMEQLQQYRTRHIHQLHDVKIVNNSIEDFKQKAKII